ncbi:MAG: sodium-dependent transporter [Methylophilaceae bacterium]
MSRKRGHWSSRWTFMLATAGSAIGLGNIWKLPYMIGVNGGSAFVLIFIASIIFVAIPLMMTEIMLGRRAHKNPLDAVKSLAEEANVHSLWSFIGGMGMLAGILILSFYSVVGGWVLSYISFSLQGTFTNITATQATSNFTTLLAEPFTLLFWHTLFLLMTMIVVARGVNEGLEKANNILIPLLFAILLILLGYSMSVGDMAAAFKFMFSPDFSKVTPVAILSALGHAFFTLSLGMGSVMVYGSYLDKSVPIGQTTLFIATLDTVLGLLTGLAIYALVFGNHLEPDAGPGLIFQTLPIALGAMPAGNIFATLFFVLVGFAAWTSSISLVEPAVAWIIENTKISRVQASLVLGLSIWLIGLSVVLSFNIWQDVKLIFGLGIFDTLDKLTSTIMLPLGGLLMAIFAGYLMKKQHIQEELNIKGWAFSFWKISNTVIAPVAVLIVFLNLLGLY